MKTTIIPNSGGAELPFTEAAVGDYYHLSARHDAQAIMKLSHDVASNEYHVMFFHSAGKTFGTMTGPYAATVMVTKFLAGEKLIHLFE